MLSGCLAIRAQCGAVRTCSSRNNAQLLAARQHANRQPLRTRTKPLVADQSDSPVRAQIKEPDDAELVLSYRQPIGRGEPESSSSGRESI